MNSTNHNRLAITEDGLLHVTGKERVQAHDSEPAKPADWLIREAAQRGHTDLGWLQSFHSFSFGHYYDQRHMGFRSLRVINDDKIAAGRGFPTHPHRDMEIISYVLDGSLQHRDSTGRGSIITPDDIQMMSAGKGITHSEYNPSKDQANHFLQIWIEPAMRGVQPRYSEGKLTADDKTNQWKLIAGPEGSGAIVGIHQDAQIHATKLLQGESIDFTQQPSRHAWLQVATGTVSVNETLLHSGDAVASSTPTHLHMTAMTDSDVLLFDLA